MIYEIITESSIMNLEIMVNRRLDSGGALVGAPFRYVIPTRRYGREGEDTLWAQCMMVNKR